MALSKGMLSSNSSQWETPQALFDRLNAEFGFDVDVCATPDNAKCSTYYTSKQDGLAQCWGPGLVYWMNPPYGREIGHWVAKAHRAGQAGATVVCLLPARTDTRWWHDHVMRAASIRLVKGRLRFSNAPGNAPFPSVIVVFRRGHAGQPTLSTWHR